MSKCVWIAAVLTLILVLSSSILFSSMSRTAVSASNLNANSVAGSNDGNMLQYEWPQFQGDSSFTRFSAGPAPEAPDTLWKTNITAIQSYVSAFNGMVFVCNATMVFALDGETGNIIWSQTVPGMGSWPAVYKIDDTYMVVGGSCFETATGNLVWTSSSFSSNVGSFDPGAYDPNGKVFFVKDKSYVEAWNFSDPSSLPALEWSTYVPGGETVGSGLNTATVKFFQVHLKLTKWPLMLRREQFCGILKQKAPCFSQGLTMMASLSGLVRMTTQSIALTPTRARFSGLTTLALLTGTSAQARPWRTACSTN